MEFISDIIGTVDHVITRTYAYARTLFIYPYARYRWKRVPFRELTSFQQLSLAHFHGDSVFLPLAEDRENEIRELVARRRAERERSTARDRHPA